MKRFLGILICVIAFSGCDDGDLVIEKIDFDDVATSSCPDNNLLFKLKQGEALILNIPEETFIDNPTDPNTPTELDVNSNNQVVYNFYNGQVSQDNICALIPPGTPSINKQWNATSGKIQIITTAIKAVDASNNSTKITGYNNSIAFKNITFQKEDGTTQFYETFAFGDYKKSITPLPLAFKGVLFICSNNQVYEFNEIEALTLDIDSALILNEVTPTDSPRIGKIGDVKNKLVYRLFNSIITSDYFCKDKDPIIPTVSETWLGQPGGTIEVTTTTDGPTTFKHTIVFKKVALEKENSNFLLGDNYKYGELYTTK